MDDEEQIDLDVNINSNIASNIYGTLSNNILNNIPSSNLANITSRAIIQQNLQPVRQENSESNFLSLSLTKQYILYDVYRNGRDRKSGAKLTIGQSPYTLENDSQSTQSSEEIDAEIDKLKNCLLRDLFSKVSSCNSHSQKNRIFVLGIDVLILIRSSIVR